MFFIYYFHCFPNYRTAQKAYFIDLTLDEDEDDDSNKRSYNDNNNDNSKEEDDETDLQPPAVSASESKLDNDDYTTLNEDK